MTIGTVIRNISTPTVTITGLVFDGSTLWTCDLVTDTINNFALDGTPIKSFSTPGIGSRGLSWDGRTLWHGDDVTDLIYQISPDDGTVIKSFGGVILGINALSWAENTIWVVETTNDLFVQISPQNGTIVKSIAIPVGASSPLGVDFIDNNLLYYDNITNLIYMINMDGVVIWSFSAPGATMTDITFDGRTMLINNFDISSVQQISLN